MKLDINLNWNDKSGLRIDKKITIFYNRLHGEIDTDSIEIFRNGHDMTLAFETLDNMFPNLWDRLKSDIEDNEDDTFDTLNEIYSKYF